MVAVCSQRLKVGEGKSGLFILTKMCSCWYTFSVLVLTLQLCTLDRTYHFHSIHNLLFYSLVAKVTNWFAISISGTVAKLLVAYPQSLIYTNNDTYWQYTHIVKSGIGHLQLVKALQKRPLSFLLHVIVRRFLQNRREGTLTLYFSLPFISFLLSLSSLLPSTPSPFPPLNLPPSIYCFPSLFLPPSLLTSLTPPPSPPSTLSSLFSPL